VGNTDYVSNSGSDSHRCATAQSLASRWASTWSRVNDMDDDSHHTGHDSSYDEEDGIQIALDLISPILSLPFGYAHGTHRACVLQGKITPYGQITATCSYGRDDDQASYGVYLRFRSP
jgi:hypothetical protein